MSAFGESKIGFTNGCFDVLHIGHIKLFEFVKQHSDLVIVAIDSDDRVRSLKGESRPFNNQKDRAYMLKSLEAVDEVVIFDSEYALRQLVKKYSPDVMVVGSDYKDKEVIGSEHAKQLKFFERIDGYSTTKIIESSATG